ncbi:uncharacterized protein TRIADDRAFT_28251 [Trichoplax adhaerens]|uniref:palmitoyl-CoA hydrolase n=1 Tax=Trichoplax adhaerens TaxID=10228 RepID=B3S2U2_TRIAD|nr:hypothetical protein TRIADDRAFT_28251 [Trichoplax adhaerens]EDV22848.1 hypothetical protein TRIADDRAFT_28251 [Trichoplax adhaerens]|eukprot:XP_002114714.1 hypothetical protein TRIADDRAFT_28251 [Trichoplax adhaerens]
MASIASSYPRDDVVAHIEGTRPLVIIHGLFEYSSSLSSLKHMITKAFPKIQIYIPDLFPGYFSVWTPLWKQVESFNEYLKPIFANTTKNGINLLCFSQGGIICRGILQTASNHTVRNFISLSGPLMGQFGGKNFKIIVTWVVNLSTSDTKKSIFYSIYGQKLISIANFWNDPHHQKLYLKYVTYLTALNNQTCHSSSQVFKSNFLKVKKVILIGGPDDGVITPWQSSQFGFYDKHLKIIYIKDFIGLRSIDKRNDLHLFTIGGVKHKNWHTNATVFNCCIRPFLK